MEQFLTGENDWLWDEAEYNFFMSLTDMAKLEYMYDYFNLDFNESYDSDSEVIFEIDDQDEPIRTDVVITDTHLMITCPDPRMMSSTVNMFFMDGWLLSLQTKKHDTLIYNIVGKSSPISVN